MIKANMALSFTIPTRDKNLIGSIVRCRNSALVFSGGSWMANFKEKLEQIMETKAYLLGGDAYSEAVPNQLVTCPFTVGSQAYNEWQDGFQDAAYLHGLWGENQYWRS
jgi:hypothetical protein